MDGLVETAAGLDRAAQMMVDAVAVLARLDLGGAALATAAPGQLGETGRALSAQLVVAVSARSREAEAAGARLAEAAQTLRRAAAGYLGADHAARSRIDRLDEGAATAWQ